MSLEDANRVAKENEVLQQEQNLLEETLKTVLGGDFDLKSATAAIEKAISELNLARFINPFNLLKLTESTDSFPADTKNRLIDDILNKVVSDAGDIDAPKNPRNGLTLALNFCSDKSLLVTDKILSLGADKSQKDISGLGLAYHGVMANDMAMLQLLQKHDVPFDLPNPNNETLLQPACANGNLEMAKYLVETMGIDCTIREKRNHFNALDTTAYYSDSPEMIAYLVDANVEFSANNGFKVDPLQLALLAKNYQNVAYFMDIGLGDSPFDKEDISHALTAASYEPKQKQRMTDEEYQEEVQNLISKHFGEYIIRRYQNVEDFLPFLSDIEHVQIVCRQFNITPMNLLAMNLDDDKRRLVMLAFGS